MDFQTRKTYYNRCDPFEPLAPEDARNLDVDSFGSIPVRGTNWVEQMAELIKLSDKPVFELFTGLPGSGKSTELRRLAARLADPQRFHLLPVLVDAEELIDLSNTVDIPDIIAAVLQRTEETVLEGEGRDPEQAMEEGYMARLWAWLKNTDVELGRGEWSIPSGPKLVVEMKTRPTLRQRVRQAVSAHLTRVLKEAGEELVRLQDRAHTLGYNGLLVIFDSLEKLRGVSSNWHEVLASAEQVFALGGTYLRLPVHVIYTIPPALVTRCVDPVHFMPMIALRTRGGSRFAPGLAAARELIRCRVPDAVLTDLLGEKTEERLEELLRWSGGYPREIVRLLRSAFAVPQAPITDNDLQRLVSEVCDAYRRIVPIDAFEWLARVARFHDLSIASDGHRPAADLMLLNNAVLRYVNGGEWFDLHPAVHRIPGVDKAKRRLAASAETEGPDAHGT